MPHLLLEWLKGSHPTDPCARHKSVLLGLIYVLHIEKLQKYLDIQILEKLLHTWLYLMTLMMTMTCFQNVKFWNLNETIKGENNVYFSFSCNCSINLFSVVCLCSLKISTLTNKWKIPNYIVQMEQLTLLNRTDTTRTAANTIVLFSALVKSISSISSFSFNFT